MSNFEPPDDSIADAYVVGPMRPPKNTQFKPGHSGNPRGRPKQTLTREAVARMLAEALLETKIKIRKGGRQSKTTVLQAMVTKQAHLALSGDTKAFASLFAIVERVAKDEGGAAPADDDARVDRVILRRGLAAESAEAASRDHHVPGADGGPASAAGSALRGETSDGQDATDGHDDAGEAGDA